MEDEACCLNCMTPFALEYGDVHCDGGGKCEWCSQPFCVECLEDHHGSLICPDCKETAEEEEEEL